MGKPMKAPIYNIARMETSIVIVRYSEYGNPQYLCRRRDEDFRFNDGDKYDFTCDLSLAFEVGNRVDDTPDFVLDWCNKNNFVVREVLTTRKLTHPGKNPNKHQTKTKA